MDTAVKRPVGGAAAPTPEAETLVVQPSAPQYARGRSTQNGVAPTFRRDIEGLRAVAVVLVILNHAVLWPTGGFLGVDVFFLISGFLITGLLLRQYDKRGTVEFGDFYLRRVRRILPAALLVIVVTVAVGYLLLSAPRADSVRTDGVWSLFFAENWHLVLQGADYFQAAAADSPLQHYWSLAVEEQFYLLWPLLILLIVAVAARRRLPRGRALVLTLGAVVAASFVWSTASAFLSPDYAYFDTLGRVWELGLGALLAVSSAAWLRIGDRFRPLIAWAGLALLIAAGVLVTSAMPLPAPTALVALAGAGLVVIAGTGGRQRWLWPLTNPATRYIGRISFSLYLWHFPVIIYLGVVFGAENPLLPALAITLTLVLSIASYHLVEEPFRRMGSSRRAASAPASKPAAPTAQRLNQRKLANGALVIGACVAVALVAVAILRVAPSPSPAAAVVAVAPVAEETSGDGSTPADPVAVRTTELQAALASTEWPALAPAVADFGVRGRSVIATEWEVDGCLGGDEAPIQDPIENALRCVYGDPAADAAHTAIVYGDSMAISYVPAVRAALGEGWAVKVFTMAGCPVSATSVTRAGGSAYPECDAFRDWATSQIAMIAPALVIMSEATDNARLASGAQGDAAFAEWSDATRASLATLQGAATDIVVMTRPPEGVSLYDCQTPLSTPQDCVRETEQGFERRAVALRNAVEAAGPGFTFVNTLSWFCSQGECPAFTGTTPIFADGIHLTGAASAGVGSLLAAELLTAQSQ